MNHPIKYSILFILFGLLSACIKTINIDAGLGEIQVVVDGLLVYNPNDPAKLIPDTIKIGRSVDYLDNTSRPVINDAVVIVKDSLLQVLDTLKFIGEGKYITSKIKPVIDGIYILNMYLSTGEHYRASSYINRLADFRRLYAVDTIRTVGPVGPVPKGGFVVLDAWDVAGQGDRNQGDNYRFKYFVKRKFNLDNPYFKKNLNTEWQFYYQPDNLILASESSQGNRNPISIEAPFNLPLKLAVMGVEPAILEDKPIYFPGDSIKVQIYSVTEEHLFFYNRLRTELLNGAGGGFSGLFATPIANVPTNVLGVNTDKKALGWFGAASVAEKSVEMIDY